jgi:hypothetical protein
LLRRLLLSGCLAVAAIAAQAEPLRLIAPSNGDVLPGGRFVTLAWSGDHPGAEEWEAFLSVDGGRFYSVRLTPHLDIDINRFDVLIPNVDSNDVRILIRTGDERNETILTMPQRFRIHAEALAVQPAGTQAEGPESARPNEPRVVQWSVGARVESSATPAQWTAFASQKACSTEFACVSYRWQHEAQTILSARTGRIALPRQLPRSTDRLLQSSRLNV